MSPQGRTMQARILRSPDGGPSTDRNHHDAHRNR